MALISTDKRHSIATNSSEGGPPPSAGGNSPTSSSVRTAAPPPELDMLHISSETQQLHQASGSLPPSPTSTATPRTNPESASAEGANTVVIGTQQASAVGATSPLNNSGGNYPGGQWKREYSSKSRRDQQLSGSFGTGGLGGSVNSGVGGAGGSGGVHPSVDDAVPNVIVRTRRGGGGGASTMSSQIGSPGEASLSANFGSPKERNMSSLSFSETPRAGRSGATSPSAASHGGADHLSQSNTSCTEVTSGAPPRGSANAPAGTGGHPPFVSNVMANAHSAQRPYYQSSEEAEPDHADLHSDTTSVREGGGDPSRIRVWAEGLGSPGGAESLQPLSQGNTPTHNPSRQQGAGAGGPSGRTPIRIDPGASRIKSSDGQEFFNCNGVLLPVPKGTLFPSGFGPNGTPPTSALRGGSNTPQGMSLVPPSPSQGTLQVGPGSRTPSPQAQPNVSFSSQGGGGAGLGSSGGASNSPGQRSLSPSGTHNPYAEVSQNEREPTPPGQQLYQGQSQQVPYQQPQAAYQQPQIMATSQQQQVGYSPQQQQPYVPQSYGSGTGAAVYQGGAHHPYAQQQGQGQGPYDYSQYQQYPQPQAQTQQPQFDQYASSQYPAPPGQPPTYTQQQPQLGAMPPQYYQQPQTRGGGGGGGRHA